MWLIININETNSATYIPHAWKESVCFSMLRLTMGYKLYLYPAFVTGWIPLAGGQASQRCGAWMCSVQTCNTIKPEQAIGSMPVITLYLPIIARRLSFKSPIILGLKLFSSIPLSFSFSLSLLHLFSHIIRATRIPHEAPAKNIITFLSFLFLHAGYYKKAWKMWYDFDERPFCVGNISINIDL